MLLGTAAAQRAATLASRRQPRQLLQLRCHALLVVAMARPWRPLADDVDRLSRGEGAKRRGTGSRQIPHRLNSEERPQFEAAKKRGFLAVRGSGYRRARKGHPLPNAWRLWCDAKATACVVIEQDGNGGGSPDTLVVDLAPLRTLQLAEVVAVCDALAAEAGAVRLQQRPLDAVPFDAAPLELPVPVSQLLGGGASPAAARPPPTPEAIAQAEQAVLAQADAVRALKASGLDNSSPQVQAHVQELLALKAQLQQLLDCCQQAQQRPAASAAAPAAAAAADGSSQAAGTKRRDALPEDHPFAHAATWQLPVVPLFYEAERGVAKDLGRRLAAALA